MDRPIIIVTGAGGFLGKSLVKYLSQFFAVRALARSLMQIQDLKEFSAGGLYRCHLPDDIDSEAFAVKGNEKLIIIHCAYDVQTLDKNKAIKVNFEGTKRLVGIAHSIYGCKFIFISSLAGHSGAESLYGIIKFRLEKIMEKSDLVIRPGTIIGNGGIFLQAAKMVSWLPIVPIPFSNLIGLQTVGISDLCNAIYRCIVLNILGSISVASPVQISFRDFYLKIAQVQKKRALFLPIPIDLMFYSLLLAENLGLQLSVTSQNILGIKSIKYKNTREDLRKLSIELQSFEECMALLHSKRAT